MSPNTIFNVKSVCNTIASRDSPGLAEIKTYAQKMQDAQVTKSLGMLRVIKVLSVLSHLGSFHEYVNHKYSDTLCYALQRI